MFLLHIGAVAENTIACFRNMTFDWFVLFETCGMRIINNCNGCCCSTAGYFVSSALLVFPFAELRPISE